MNNTLDAAIYREYDGLIGVTMLNIYSLSKRSGVIRLYNFNRKDKEHLYFLHVALIARSVYQMPIEVYASWWDVFCINMKIHKGFNKITRITDERLEGICVPEILDFMRADGIERLGKDFSFGEIYKAYYEGK